MSQTALDREFAAMRGTGRPDAYFTKNGERIPSTTTITGRFKDPHGLYWWHWKNGQEGREFGDGGEPATQIGSLVHRMVEAQIHGLPKPQIPKEQQARVMSAYGAFERWWESNRFEVVATEVPLVSEEWKFGGTIDTILRDVNGALCLGDWKSSKAVYAEYLTQMAAYRHLWDSAAPSDDLKLSGGFHLVRFSKEFGDMEHRHFPELDDAWTMFTLMRQAYELDKILKGRAK
jgi:hypothetical protein